MTNTRRPSGSASLDAAGITDPQLRSDLLTCRALMAGQGRSYSLATALLPASKRPWVWALYAFGRYADDFVDSLSAPNPAELLRWSGSVLSALAGEGSDDGGPVGRAMAATVTRWRIDHSTVASFLSAMRADITVSRYATFGDLQGYMDGSAVPIGLQMLPILEVLPGAESEAQRRGTMLAYAFQMTNILRDVGEDLDLGRIYLPAEDLATFGVTEDNLFAARQESSSPPQGWDPLIRFQVQRTREMYRQAEPGIKLLHPTSRDSVRCAARLYSSILDAVEGTKCSVLHRKVGPSPLRRTQIVLSSLLRARKAELTLRMAR